MGDNGKGLDWRNVHLWQIQPIRDVLVVAGVLALLWLGYALSVVTVPILVALLLAYLFEPVVQKLTRVRWISRPGAAGGVIAAAALIIVVPVTLAVGFALVQGVTAAHGVAENAGRFMAVRDFVRDAADEEGTFHGRVLVRRDDSGSGPPRIEFEGRDLETRQTVEEPQAAFDRMPPFWRRVCVIVLEDSAARVNAAYGGDESGMGVGGEGAWGPAPRDGARSLTALIDMSVAWIRANAQVIAGRAIGTGYDAVSALMRTFTSIGMALFMGFLTAFFFFFFCTGYPSVLRFGRSLIPEAKRQITLDLLGKMDRVIAGFVRGRLTIAFLQSVFFSIAYWAVGVPAPLLVGPLVGLLSIVPYVALIGIPLSIGLMFLEPVTGFRAAWWWVLAAPTAVYFIGQALDDYVLTPAIQGKSTQMDTPSILFASIAGGVLAGVYGLLLAIPVAACLKILIREVFWPRFQAWAEGRETDFLPIDRD